jgi:hypothetical protein
MYAMKIVTVQDSTELLGKLSVALLQETVAY